MLELSQDIIYNQNSALYRNIFNAIHHNGSSIYFHVIICKHKSHHQLTDLLQRKALFSTGYALHGSVKMIKYDRIPKHFHHKYLLSDFGMVELTEEESKYASMSCRLAATWLTAANAHFILYLLLYAYFVSIYALMMDTGLKLAMPLHTVIPYWKPEVAIKLISDFDRYPMSDLPEAIAKNSIQKGNKGMYYKPALHVDEIGLTSDKYVYLNATVTSLPLKISFGPMSIQV
jgi:hypothetical protein